MVNCFHSLSRFVCFVLFCSVLFFSVLFCSVLFFSVLSSFLSFFTFFYEAFYLRHYLLIFISSIYFILIFISMFRSRWWRRYLPNRSRPISRARNWRTKRTIISYKPIRNLHTHNSLKVDEESSNLMTNWEWDLLRYWKNSLEVNWKKSRRNEFEIDSTFQWAKYADLGFQWKQRKWVNIG